MSRFTVALLAGTLFLSSAAAARAGDRCELFGEIAVEAVKNRATQACVVTKHPVACAVAFALNTAAGDGLAKKGTTAGCDWAVEMVGKVLKVKITANDAKGEKEAKAAEAELKKAKEYQPKAK